ncbi:UvrD-helicase domain-containing protein, partial [Alphaproteobacteria bacterium]|nr:UvrD-helicase domain-containing protein [Alphaproteobacteria bacterium]
MENDPFDLGTDAPAPTAPQAGGGSISQKAAQAVQARRLEPLLGGLNEEQGAAVTAEDGPLLLLAGAGTGKTRALTTRIAYKIATQQAWPSQILAVTFTNKAAREMKERIGSMLGETVEGMPWLGTFHSLSAKILRIHAELVDLRPDFTILDTDDQIRLLKQLIKAENIDEKRWPARQMAILIDRWKNRGWLPENVPEGEAGFFANGMGGKLYSD